LAVTACLLAQVAANARADDATSIFSKDGIATQSLGTHFEETQFSSVEARPDGGVVAQRGQQLESYLASGAPDPAAPPRKVPYYRKAFPLGGGKSLVTGEFRLTRVNADGSLDTSFGGTGTIKVPIPVQAAVELPSGKILIAYASSGGTHSVINDLSVALIGQDGSIDRSLGTNGLLTVMLPSDLRRVTVVGIAATGEGGALVVGGSFLFEARPDGSANPGFGSSGLVTSLPALAGARLLPDGSIEAVGSGDGPTGEDVAILRYTAAGSPDLAFGPGGLRTFDFGGDEEVRAASWAADGSVVLGGSSLQAGTCREAGDCEGAPILAAFDPSGDPDPGFGDGGVVRLSALAGTSQAWGRDGVNAITRRPDGSIVAAGGAPPRHTLAFLAALAPSGALLPGFGEGGIVGVREALPATQRVAGLARLASGKLLAAGTTDVGFDRAPVLIRYEADGSLDPSFGAGAGYVQVGDSNVAKGFAVNAAGQALVGVYGYPHSQLTLRAVDGEPVPAFGSGGTVELPSRVVVQALGFASNGDALVAANRNVAGEAEPGVVLRFLPSGRPDRGFGGDGRVVPHPPGGGEMRVRALGSGPRGRMLVGGVAGRRFSAGRRFAMTMLLPDGRPDPRFGNGGWALANAGGIGQSLRLRRAGPHIYLAGIARDGERLRVVLLRFGKDGRPDLTFGRRGRFTAAIPGPAQVTATVPLRSGTLVVLSKGRKPLLLFGRDGKVRRLPAGARPQFAENVRATVAAGRLLLGWNAFSRAVGRGAYHLASRSLR